MTSLFLLATLFLHKDQHALHFLGCLGTLLAHVQPAVKQHPYDFFRWATFQPLFPKLVALHGVVVTQVQDWAGDTENNWTYY